MKVKLSVLLDLSSKTSFSLCLGLYPLPPQAPPSFSGVLYLSHGPSNFNIWDRTDHQVYTSQSDSNLHWQSPQSLQPLSAADERPPGEVQGEAPGEASSVLGALIAAKPVST